MMIDKKNKMRIVGRNYRHLVEVWDIRPTGENEVGEKTQEPKKIGKIWTDINPMRGKQYYEAQKLDTIAEYKITTYYREGLNESMILKWKHKGRYLDIISIIDISGAEEHMEIICKESVEKYEF